MTCIAATQRPDLPARQEATLDVTPRTTNGFLSALAADDFERIRPHLKPADRLAESVLVGAGDTLRRAWLPHRGVISLIVDLSKGEHVQVTIIGRDSLFGIFSAPGDPVALASGVVRGPGITSTGVVEQL